MGRQVEFLFDDADMAVLDEHLREVGAVSIPQCASSPELDPRQGLAFPLETNWFAYIIREADLPKARRTYQPTPWAEPPSDGYWGLDREIVPTVDYMRGTADDPQRPGRLHFDVTRLENERIVPMDAEFVAWASGLLKWIRKTYSYDKANCLYKGPPKARRSPSGSNPAI